MCPVVTKTGLADGSGAPLSSLCSGRLLQPGLGSRAPVQPSPGAAQPQVLCRGWPRGGAHGRAGAEGGERACFHGDRVEARDAALSRPRLGWWETAPGGRAGGGLRAGPLCPAPPLPRCAACSRPPLSTRFSLLRGPPARSRSPDSEAGRWVACAAEPREREAGPGAQHGLAAARLQPPSSAQ